MSSITVKGITHELVYDDNHSCNGCSLRKKCDEVEKFNGSLLCTTLRLLDGRSDYCYFQIKK